MQELEKLTTEDNRFEALFNSASLGIIVGDTKGHIVMSNHFANQLFGYDDVGLIGEFLEKIIPQRFHKHHVKHRDGFIKDPKARSMGIGMTLSALRKDGSEFPVEISLGHFEKDNEKFVLAYIADITMRKEAEAKMLSQQNELEKEKEVNDLKSRFVSMASHEFRTPLSTILSSISLLAKYTETEEQPKRDKHIDRIKSSVKSLTDILNEFLSLGKIEEGKVDIKPYEFNLCEFINSMKNELQVLLKPGQRINYTHKGQENTFTDSSILKHIVINILSNAIKFSPDKAVIQINTSINHSTTIIQITDQGIGIPKDDQVHLFERFFRATNVTNIQGTGLGLHIVGRYVELLKGTIEYTSELEKGSSFTIKLPSELVIEYN
jgi:PAS domain S-box-containing protein